MGFKIATLHSGGQAVAFLNTAVFFTRGELSKHKYLAPLFAEVLRLQEVVPEARAQLIATQALKLREGAAMAKALKDLKIHTRHFRRVVRMQVTRNLMDKDDLSFYVQPHEWKNPMEKIKDFRHWSRAFIDGDRRRVANGGKPMSNPSADELETVREAYLSALKDYRLREQSHKDAKSAMDGYFREIQELYKLIAHTVKVLLIDEKPAYVRNVLRNIGYKFINTDHPDAVDVPEVIEEAVVEKPVEKEVKAVAAGEAIGVEAPEADGPVISHDGSRVLYDGLDIDDYREFYGKEPFGPDSS